jgi:hypothetical protein
MLLIPQGEDTGGEKFLPYLSEQNYLNQESHVMFLRTPYRRGVNVSGVAFGNGSPPAFWDATTFESGATFEAAILQFESRRPAHNGGHQAKSLFNQPTTAGLY